MLFYDFEVFKYDWLVVIIDVINKREHVVVNDPDMLQSIYEANKKNIWVGYNSRHYDQWILRAILCGFNPKELNDHIIIKNKPAYQYSSLLNKISLNNFDVMTVQTGLKSLEGFMGNDIKESSVPFNIDRKLTLEEIEETVKYCRHDVEQTLDVFIQRKDEFDAHMGLVRLACNGNPLDLSLISKTKVQLSAHILDARKPLNSRDDEFEISFPPTMQIEKYRDVVRWYENPLNRDYEKVLNIAIAGVPHVFAWGGIHGAIPQYSGEGIFLNVDVASYYPTLMIEYGFGSRNMSNPDKYKEIYHQRLKYKAEKNPLANPLKIVLNGTYGAMKDKNNNLYDPRQANNVCVGGQLLLLDLIEKLEPHCQIIQSNTDGILVKLNSIDDYDLIDDIAYEWECRTRMQLEFDLYQKIFQKDVNNYVIVDFDGKYKSKGAYVKELSDLDYDLPILNEAVINYMVKRIPVEETISNCNRIKEFQKIVKVSSKYSHALYNPTITEEKINGKKVKVFTGGQVQKDKCFRVFASRNAADGGLFKVKNKEKNPEKFANTPDSCFIVNDNVNGKSISRRLDKKWYMDLATKRLRDFGVI